jgi:hypothetical protein
MVKFPKLFEFICEDEIEYHSKGGALTTTHSLTLKAPNAMSAMTPLIKQDIMIAVMANARNSQAVRDDGSDDKEKSVKPKSDDELSIKMDGKLFLMLLYGSTSIKMSEFKSKFFKLLKEKNICLLDNEVSITDQHISYISDKEFDRLMSEYFTNFFSF